MGRGEHPSPPRSESLLVSSHENGKGVEPSLTLAGPESLAHGGIVVVGISLESVTSRFTSQHCELCGKDITLVATKEA